MNILNMEFGLLFNFSSELQLEEIFKNWCALTMWLVWENIKYFRVFFVVVKVGSFS